MYVNIFFLLDHGSLINICRVTTEIDPDKRNLVGFTDHMFELAVGGIPFLYSHTVGEENLDSEKHVVIVDESSTWFRNLLCICDSPSQSVFRRQENERREVSSHFVLT